jgi:N-acetylglucosamine-6-sulfatase
MPSARARRPVAILVLCLFAATPAARATPAPAADRPNIIFIFSDDHATQAISAYGSTRNTTPNIDRLAAAGMTFDRFMCGNSICAPSRATILTGTHSHINGVIDNAAVFDGSQPTLPKILGEAGYATAMLGKWHLKSDPTGFDTWMVLPGQGDYYNPDFLVPGGRIRTTGHSTELITDAAIAWLGGEAVADGRAGAGRPADRPFLLMVQYKGPHRNWMPAPSELGLFRDGPIAEPPTLFDDYAGRNPGARTQEMEIDRHMFLGYDLKGPEVDERGVLVDLFGRQTTRMNAAQRRAWEDAYRAGNEAFLIDPPAGDDLVRWKYQRYIADYLRVIAGLDRHIGRLLDAVDAAGLADDTIVIYASDQGFYLGEHGWYDKRWMYEESLRMPFLVRWPGVVTPGTRTAALAQNIDVMPTLLAAAGVPAEAVPDRVQGRSLLAVIRGDGAAPADWRDALYYRYYEAESGPHAVPQHYGVRTDRHKLIRYPDLDAWELFDLERDPDELRSVHDDPAYAAVRTDLERRLAELQAAFGDAPELDAAAIAGRAMRERAMRAPREVMVDVRLLPGESDPVLPTFDPSAAALRIVMDIVPQGPTGVLLAHGGGSYGYTLELVDGRPRFSVRDRGRVWSAAMPAAGAIAMGARVRVIATLDPTGAILVRTDDAASPLVPATVLTAPPAEGLQLGEDRGSIVGPDGDMGPFVGRIERVRIVRGGDGRTAE